jgi:hypothetical protein
MVFGHNTNLKLGAASLHVQTEDRGEAHALIDTSVYYHGRVLHRRTNNYFDLLPMSRDRELVLRQRVDEQHRAVLDEIRSGALHLAIPQEPAAPRAPEKSPLSAIFQPLAPPAPKKLVLDLINAKSWLSGKQAKLQILVREQNGTPSSGTQVRVEFEGSERRETFYARTDSHGEALLEFVLPRIVSREAAMLISGQSPTAKGHLKFALRPKSHPIL